MTKILDHVLPFAAATVASIACANGLSAQIINGNGNLPIFNPITLSITGVVNVACTSGNDVVTVAYAQSGTVKVSRGVWSKTFNLSQVQKVHVDGGDGDDSIRNYTSIPSDFDGGNGNDYLLGGAGDDRLVGNYGQDTIYGGAGDDEILGSGGSDYLSGQDGDDDIRGHGGNDTIYGGNGRDSIYGGSGNDTIYGDAGQDLIVTVGGGTDYIRGGYQWDNFWVDGNDVIYDGSSNEYSLGYVHRIYSFMTLKSPGVTYTPSIEPAGQNFADPLPRTGHSVMLQNNASVPLFGPGGPDEQDIVQGDVGDCYFMAMLSAVAHQQPEEIRKLVTSLGDGTFAVRFFRNGQPRYIRVDGDLWAWGNNGQIAYADLGMNGNVLWVPIVEKAFAWFREEAGTFASIHGGHTSWEHHTAMIGADTDGFTLPTSPSKQTIIDWHAAGRTNFWTTWTLRSQSTELLEWIDDKLAAGRPIYTGARSGISNYTSISEDNYRRGQHLYHVFAVQRDSSGNATGLVLRDPYGQMRTLTDYARIVFCVGRATSLTF